MRNDLTIYDRVADRWWSDDVRWIRTLKNLARGRLTWLDRVIDWPGKHVLDLGCAGGFMAEAMARRGARVTGIDPARRAIEAARRHAGQESLDIAYDVGVGESLPYADTTFDLVVCVDVLEHVHDPWKVVREVRRVLKPAGVFAYDTINRTLLARVGVVTLGEAVLGLLPRGTHDPAMFITPEELRVILERAGLVPDAIVGIGPTGLDRHFDLTFGRVPFTGILYAGLARRKPDAEETPSAGDRTLAVGTSTDLSLPRGSQHHHRHGS